MSVDDSPAVQAAARFAAEKIAPRTDLADVDGFPDDLWTAMAAAGLFGYGIAPQYGGAGLGPEDLARTAGALVRAGGNVPAAAAWAVHTTAARQLLQRLAGEEAKAELLPAIALGESSAAMALSEPGVGAHPKRLSTRAVRDGDAWQITGSKAYISNGPRADWYVVLAVSSEEGGRKAFTGFLVNRDWPGVTRATDSGVDFPGALGHCGLELREVRVPDRYRVGAEGAGDAEILRRVRIVEDSLMAPALTEAVGRRIAAAAAHLRNAGGADDETASALGRMASEQRLLALAAPHLLAHVEAGGDDAALFGYRAVAHDLHDGFDSLRQQLTGGAPLDALDRDMLQLGRVARSIDALRYRALGRGLVQKTQES
ncbi:acyl-CoA dehydrogenase family protein [Marinibaculum pumilum]|uniref:Acyl-CoA dehydrogenase family protein n=1 Tax=Marinibaculum pumilum TaxID=1766165 RepID=A0ABV7KWS0_9PROT